ncbi:DNA mismatch repair protein MutS [Lutibacter holmesii]|uniref:DNA mismatch repair protein MutS n=1 Tax=Lutibacter holmesii TaxID=1137985 RepID=A0ABW3WR72_9FLAO
MGFNIGDKVSVIDDVITGKVIEVHPTKIVLETSDGFPFEFAPKELVVIKQNQADLSKYSDISNEALLRQKEEFSAKKKTIKFKTDVKPEKQPPMEVDLHIHNLTASVKGLDNYDMLTIQMDHAKHKLEFAIRNRIPKIVFIHGVGAGVLKSELEYMFKNYPVQYYEASYKKYGLGATEVYVYQNPKN